ncbi:hypothetical protein GA0061105_108271 [Rhizobium aethiopicum]|uniref:Uncharacterized protein n=1 Tax=Rhizobium aethiopicum TaxID=1138170 RepID=A0A1C3Y600_9HYPH|nr:hypothetical protein GA0061105_108271 [Rhizobium aethiopicum]
MVNTILAAIFRWTRRMIVRFFSKERIIYNQPKHCVSCASGGNWSPRFLAFDVWLPAS